MAKKAKAPRTTDALTREGAAAILRSLFQSRDYDKTIESLLNLTRFVGGQASLNDVLKAAILEQSMLDASMASLLDRCDQWKYLNGEVV